MLERYRILPSFTFVQADTQAIQAEISNAAIVNQITSSLTVDGKSSLDALSSLTATLNCASPDAKSLASSLVAEIQTSHSLTQSLIQLQHLQARLESDFQDRRVEAARIGASILTFATQRGTLAGLSATDGTPQTNNGMEPKHEAATRQVGGIREQAGEFRVGRRAGEKERARQGSGDTGRAGQWNERASADVGISATSIQRPAKEQKCCTERSSESREGTGRATEAKGYAVRGTCGERIECLQLSFRITSHPAHLVSALKTASQECVGARMMLWGFIIAPTAEQASSESKQPSRTQADMRMTSADEGHFKASKVRCRAVLVALRAGVEDWEDEVGNASACACCSSVRTLRFRLS